MIKKLFIVMVVALLPLAASAQFEQDKFYVGTSLTGLDLNYSGQNKLNIGVQAQGGIFAADNLLLYVQGGWNHQGKTMKDDQVEVGAGGRYYILQNGIFLGVNCKYVHGAGGYNDVMPGVEVGYAFFLSRTVTIEPAIYYQQSFKDHSDFSKVGLRVGFGFYI
jgi:hypothetical protein